MADQCMRYKSRNFDLVKARLDAINEARRQERLALEAQQAEKKDSPPAAPAELQHGRTDGQLESGQLESGGGVLHSRAVLVLTLTDPPPSTRSEYFL